ncbi:MAG: tetratricopeptide repeat protein [Planctomycetes bacterium]|nr:tetratricopeptide repeat protein [Planctomycetota bacterium]
MYPSSNAAIAGNNNEIVVKPQRNALRMALIVFLLVFSAMIVYLSRIEVYNEASGVGFGIIFLVALGELCRSILRKPKYYVINEIGITCQTKTTKIYTLKWQDITEIKIIQQVFLYSLGISARNYRMISGKLGLSGKIVAFMNKLNFQTPIVIQLFGASVPMRDVLSFIGNFYERPLGLCYGNIACNPPIIRLYQKFIKPYKMLSYACIIFFVVLLIFGVLSLYEDAVWKKDYLKANAYYEQKDYKNAEEYAQKILDFTRKRIIIGGVEKNLNMRDSMALLANSLRMQDKHFDAQRIYKRILTGLESNFSITNAAVGQYSYALGDEYLLLNDYIKAEVYLKRSLLSHDYNKWATDEEIAYISNGLGVIYMEQGDYKESEIMLTKSLKIYEGMKNESNNFDTATIMLNLADLYFRTGRNVEAQALTNRANEIKTNMKY